MNAAAEGTVASLYEDYLGLVDALAQESPSGLAALNRSYHKHLLMAAASSLENRVKSLLPDIFVRLGRPELGAFVERQVTSRGYHTLFDWRTGRAQGFFASFGQACGAAFRADLKSDSRLLAEHDAFMRLGQLRNEVVHNDYASRTIDLTPLEVMELYAVASGFPERFEYYICALDHAGEPETEPDAGSG